MTGLQFVGNIRNKTRTNSSTFTDADIILSANAVKDDIAERIVKLKEDYFQVPTLRNLVASSSTDITKREYPLPDDYLGLVRVQAKFDATNWIRLTELDLNTYKLPIDETDITNTFSNLLGEAKYHISRRGLWIYSGTIAAVTSGLEIVYNAYPADIGAGDLAGATDLSIDPTTTTFALPRQLHNLWVMGVVVDYKTSREKPLPLTDREQNYQFLLHNALQSLINTNQDREIIASVPYNDGSQY